MAPSTCRTEIMITQTKFAVNITKVPLSSARKRMRDDLADQAGIHAFRGVKGSTSLLAGQKHRDVSCVLIAASFASACCRSGL